MTLECLRGCADARGTPPCYALVMHPALEDLIVAVSTTVGAWLVAHQFGWLFWG